MILFTVDLQGILHIGVATIPGLFLLVDVEGVQMESDHQERKEEHTSVPNILCLLVVPQVLIEKVCSTDILLYTCYRQILAFIIFSRAFLEHSLQNFLENHEKMLSSYWFF